jgi:predicted nucleotidyltransferase
MIPLIEEHRAELEALCRRHGVKTLELFGSAADGTFDPARSDLDFLVEFLPDATLDLFHGYFDLLEGLESVFHRKVDLVSNRKFENRFFQREVDRNRKVIYAA